MSQQQYIDDAAEVIAESIRREHVDGPGELTLQEELAEASDQIRTHQQDPHYTGYADLPGRRMAVGTYEARLADALHAIAYPGMA